VFPRRGIDPECFSQKGKGADRE
jgi:hypothetical protein